MTKLFCLFAISFWLLALGLLQGCSVVAAPRWMERQFSPANPIGLVTDCGPVTASNAVCLKSGRCLGKEQARAFRPQPLLWTMNDISDYLLKYGVTYAAVSPSTIQQLASGRSLTFIVFDGIHFKIVQHSKGKLIAYDALFGVYSVTWADVRKAVGSILII